jgi:3-deoxy-D-manno-octulosonic-acid transferase
LLSGKSAAAKIRKSGNGPVVSFAAQFCFVLLLYNVFIQVYFFAIWFASLWNKKAAAWIEGRKDLFETLAVKLADTEKTIWVHCSSAGEFEQAKPVIEALKRSHPQKKVVLSFFSPSGYAVAKNYAPADVITYLPLDSRKNAERFYRIVNPELALFVKYEFWYHHLSVAAFHHVPVLLISAAFRKEQIFFRWHGRFFKQMLFLFRHIFVQDKASLELLQGKGILHASISGDTRFDRVRAIAQNVDGIPFITEFVAGRQVIVAGSTWPGDEEVLAQYAAKNIDAKLIIAPHVVDTKHIENVRARFRNSILFSGLKNEDAGNELMRSSQTLIINTVGLLSRLYRHATIAYVGGGFTKDGIHNILEAAVWSKPVIVGPNYEKYREGTELIAAGGAFSFSSADGFKKIADDLLTNEDHLQNAGLKAKAYVDENTGATERIVQYIYEKRLLTNW